MRIDGKTTAWSIIVLTDLAGLIVCHFSIDSNPRAGQPRQWLGVNQMFATCRNNCIFGIAQNKNCYKIGHKSNHISKYAYICNSKQQKKGFEQEQKRLFYVRHIIINCYRETLQSTTLWFPHWIKLIPAFRRWNYCGERVW